jgi:ATP-dependent DNA helicase RecG
MAARRLETIVATRDGFVIAEKDLAMRGPGEVLGTRQAGFAGLRVGDPFRDHEWLEATREEAERLASAEDAASISFRQRVQNDFERRLAALGAG